MLELTLLFSKSVKNHEIFSQNQKVTFNNLLGQTLCYEKKITILAFI